MLRVIVWSINPAARDLAALLIIFPLAALATLHLAAAAAVAGSVCDYVLAAAQPCQSGSLPDVVSGNAYFLVYRQVISPFGGSDDIAAATQQAADTAAAADGPPHDEHQAGALVADATSQSVRAPTTTYSQSADAAVVGPADANGGSEDLPAPLLQQVFVGRLLQQLQALPPELQQRVAELHQEFAAACLSFTKDKQQALQRVTQRREVRARRHTAAAAAQHAPL